MGAFYRSQHELVLVWKNGTAPHVNTFGLGDKGRYRTNVWNYAGVNSFRSERMDELAMHPTVKPIDLVADAILDTSKRGDIILDSFAGSGTTFIAANRTGRCAYGIELSPHYVDLILRRLIKESGLQALHNGSSKSFAELELNSGDKEGNVP
jgi:DNA modification methylase